MMRPMALVAVATMAMLPASATFARQYHVAKDGRNNQPGTAAEPLRTISAAAQRAQPGDVITVHEGTYRERVNPPRGGTSDAKRIVYRAAEGEDVAIKGSEPVTGWEKVQHDTWQVTLPNQFFGQFNPYQEKIRGDWFHAQGRTHHRGAVYLNGHGLAEAASREKVLAPAGEKPRWFAQVDDTSTTIWAQFNGVHPNEQQVEINVRRTVFYPDKPGRNYITVRGFTLEHAATPWAPPTAEQVGLIGTHWSKGWIIENNTIRYSRCVGITLGKYGDKWDNAVTRMDDKPDWLVKEIREGTGGYIHTIKRALKNGWSRDNIGHHVVRNNHISHCGQAGIVGSLGAVFCTIAGNEIHDIYIDKPYFGHEMAGIKLHGPIDTIIARNRIYRCHPRGIWLDWMSQGTRVTRNLLHDNPRDLFLEVNHGPLLIDHNLLLSARAARDWSQGTAWAHNLIAGRLTQRGAGRRTPYHKPHSTAWAGRSNITGGDNRLYNNILLGAANLSVYNDAPRPMHLAGNVYINGARPAKQADNPLVASSFKAAPNLIERSDGVYLRLKLDPAWAREQTHSLVTTELLGKAQVPEAAFERADGAPYRLDTDYRGRKRNAENPFPGPFAQPAAKQQTWKVWPAKPGR
jgi:alpha-N-arabinofuranosidase